jgi:hypothetical protein
MDEVLAMDYVVSEVVMHEEGSEGFANDELQIDISREAAQDNYRKAGERVPCDVSKITWERNSRIFNPSLKLLVDQVLSEVNYEHNLTEFQEIFLHALGSKNDVFAVTSTGTGKSEVTGLAALLLRKIFEEPKGLVVVFVPLSGILDEMVENQKIPTAGVTMSGQIFGLDENGVGHGSVTEVEILGGKFARLVMHPEALKNHKIEKLMLLLKQKQYILGAFVDEFHVMQPQHWASFRPDMEEQTARLRVFLRKTAPTGALSATATKADVDRAVDILGLKGHPIVLAQSPLQSQHKFVLLQRPSDNYGFEGFKDKNNKYHPGLLDQLRVIYIDEYVRSILEGNEPKHAVIFFRTENQLILLLNYLRQTLSISNARSAPFVCLISSTPPVTELIINKRKGRVSLYLTTQKMLLGVNVPRLDICIFVKPMNTPHAILQGAGRTGRPISGEPGIRTRSVVYILSNGGDVGLQVKGMSDEVRNLVSFKGGCLRDLLKDSFLDSKSQVSKQDDWCCNFCSKSFKD